VGRKRGMEFFWQFHFLPVMENIMCPIKGPFPIHCSQMPNQVPFSYLLPWISVTFLETNLCNWAISWPHTFQPLRWWPIVKPVTKKAWTKGTICNSWSLRSHTLSNRYSEHYCGVLSKPVQSAWLVWVWSWMTGRV
jgi:hypothetical protein